MRDNKPDAEPSLPPLTTPDKLSICLRGFNDIPSAEHFGEVLGAAIQQVSRWINLERLDGITVAYDYNEALAQLDRGYAATRPLSPTSDDNILGVAMTPPVLREGEVKAHIVVSAPWILPLHSEEDTHEARQAAYLVAHECGHVENLKHLDEAFPETILQIRHSDAEQGMLEMAAYPLWEEYAACRASSLFGPDQAAILSETILFALAGARSKCDDEICRYRIHGDVDRVLQEAGEPLFKPLRMTAYLLGHLDGQGLDMCEVPEVRDRLNGSPYAEFTQPLWEALRKLWVERGKWSSRSAFDPLKNVARDLYADGGMFLERLPDGRLYIDIPYTPNTLPK